MRKSFIFTSLSLFFLGLGLLYHAMPQGGDHTIQQADCHMCGENPSGTFAAPASKPPTASPAASVAASAETPTLPDPQPLEDPITAFSQWIARYELAEPADKQLLIDEGIRLAKARRPIFKQLIRDDPREALAKAVPMVVRQKLPAEILGELEERVNKTGVLRAYRGRTAEGQPIVKRVAELKEGRTYQAHVYGRRAETWSWTPGASLNGVAMDSDFAVNEDPLRVMEVGELPNPDKPVVAVCPVSGKTSLGPDQTAEPVEELTPAVETATETVYLCNGTHVVVYREQLIMAEGSTGGPTGFTGILPSAPTPSMGVVRVLYIPTTYADQNAVPATEATALQMMRDVSDYYATNSYGRLTLLTTVTPPVKLPHTENWYIQRDTSNGGDIDGEGLSMAHAREEAKKLGFDFTNFDCTVMRHNGGPGSYGGLGGGSTVWIRGDGAALTAHEVGHAFALGHSNFWDTAGTSAIGAGTNQEYGDSYDVMGGGGVPNEHYNSQAKSQIRWLPRDYIQDITQSGLYRIFAFDQPTLEPTKRYALNITKDAQRVYWGELRQVYTGSTSRPWADKGLLLGWRYPNGGGGNLQRIDTTPGSPFAKDDAAISLGRTFSDTDSGIHITTVAVNNNTSPKSVDVQVHLGKFPTNQRPTLTLAASSEVVPAGATVTFTATASDPDNDDLAYSWQHFGDTTYKVVEPNAPVITRTFPTNGTYVIVCTVSDMKGGTTTRSKLITVGNGNSRFTIAGRVTLGGQGLPDVVITANGANGVITDSDGYYIIPNLTATTYTMTPLLYGYTFGELFNNSVSVGPNFSGADFEATAAGTVSLTATVQTVAENASGTPGQFTLTRTGDLSSALTVNVNTAIGSATKGTDYTFSPDYAAGSQGFSTFTIPANSASLTINVTPVNDNFAEGPETITLELGQSTAYMPGSSTSATIVINDDDTTFPKVSLTSTVGSTVEGSPSPARFLFTRSGATDTALSVSYSLSGTAENGADYVTLSGTILIPAGAASTEVNVTSLNDNTAEDLETVTMRLSNGSDYLVDPLLLTATISIVDDDVQTVTVEASDATATEVDLTLPGAQADTGTFVITRTGDASAPLTVYYALAGTYNAGVAATHGVDYDALPGTLTIPAGQTQASVTILPRFDNFGEGTEHVVLRLGSGSTLYQVGAASSAVVNILDNPGDKPQVDVVQTANPAEPSTNGNFRITARGAGTGSLVVNYTISGTATSGTDFTALSGTTTLTLNNGLPVVSNISVVPINDTTPEEWETITLTITPSANYQSFGPTSSATMRLLDDEQPTVFVETQVGTSGNAHTVTEGTTSNPTKFWISRDGPQNVAVTVNYTMSGTATSGADYQALSGSVTIPSGTQGVDIPVTILDDTTFEGTETIILNVTPGGSYATGIGSATMYINDNETSTRTVAFDSRGAAGPESVGTVTIPVSLSSPATTPVTVDYEVEGGTAGTTSSTGSTSTASPPFWVRAVRSGNTFASFVSYDGVTFNQIGNASTVTMNNTGWIIGLVAGATTSGQSVSATFDNVTITDLSPGCTLSATPTHVTLGTTNPTSTSSLSGGVFTFSAGSPGLQASQTSDNVRMAYYTLTGAGTSCMVTARISGLSGGGTTSRAGVVIRESTAANARYYASLMSVDKRHYLGTRTTTGGSSTATATTQIAKPHWVRLQRTGDLFTAATSPDGSTWTTLGTPQTLALPAETLVGLAVSSRSDGNLSAATFDNVSLTPAPPGGIAFQKRSIGFVNASGTYAPSAGVHSLSGSGAAIGSSSDECDFAAMPVTGNFTLVARVTSQTTSALNAQAGVMVRESQHLNGRMLYCGTTANNSTEFIYRLRPLTHAAGVGLDHNLVNGQLSFGINEQTKNITFDVINDSINEEAEMLNIVLRNPYAAQLGSITTFTYTIEDDDSAPALPFAGFGSATSTAPEAAGTASILVSLSLPATTSTSLSYTVADVTATAGADYTLANGTVTFAPGETIKAIPLVIHDDTAIEPSETFTVTLTNPVNCQLGSINVHTFTIQDDDKPVVTILATDPDAAESGDPGAFTVTRTGPTTAALTVSFTVSGTATSTSDYASLGTSVIIPAGSASAVLTVSPIQDTANEGPETVIVTLATNSAYNIGTPSAATVTIADDDRSTVTIVANDAWSTETPGNPGQFTIHRTAPTTGTLTVNLNRTGTATNGTDYATIAATISFAANEVSKTINVLPVDDTLTEGPEVATVQITSGSYIIGGTGYADVTIEDNDSPPTIFISGPTAQGPLIASGNGIILTATAQDDGAPAPITYLWSCVNGPGTATIETPTAASTPISFSAPGTYVVRCTVTDTQFTVSDQTTVVVGSSIAGAEWVIHDLGPTTARRGQTFIKDGSFTLLGTGGGYAAATDTAHVALRQAEGTSSIIARVTSLSGATTPFAGVTMRETLQRGSKRVVLGCLTGTGLQMRTRSSAGATDTVTATVAGIVPPVWIKLERTLPSGDITGSYAPDVSGAPGTWIAVGTASALYTTSRAALGLTTTSNNTAATATGVFDNVTLTPAANGPALIAEESSTAPNLPGTFSESAGTYTIAGSPTGVFYGWQFYGDLMVTARHASATSGAGSATSGIVIREANDGGARVQLGRIPTSSYNGYFWTSIAGGSSGGVPSFTGTTRWVRLVRKGNTITAFHAPDSGGNPGTWAQLGQSQTVIMPVPVLVGFSVNNSTGVGLNTVTFTNLSIVPLNKAPIIDIANTATYPLSPVMLDGTVTDDNFPTPISLTTQWSQRSGPGTLIFGNPGLVDTTATVTAGGSYVARLQADDTSATTFRDIAFNAYLNPFQVWQAQNWSPALTDPAAGEHWDADYDGQVNLLEYAFGTAPNLASGTPVTYSQTVVGSDTFLRISVPKNPAATDVTITAEACSDMQSWTSAGLVVETNTSTLLVVRDHIPITPGSRRFMRVRVTRS